MNQLTTVKQPSALPVLITQTDDRAQKRFLEFFAVTIRNPNTRRAYYKGIAQFMDWCASRGVTLETIEPMVVAAYIEQLTQEKSPSTVKQRLAAIRMLFDWLVTGQIMPFNPASSVKAPTEVLSTGKTPILYEEDAREFFESIDTSTLIGKRDKAILAVMTYGFTRVGAIVKMKIKDYQIQGRKAFLVLHEKGGKFNRIPLHHKTIELIEDWLSAAVLWEDKEAPLFRSFAGRGRSVTDRGLATSDVLAMVKRRAKKAGFTGEICNHTFRGTGITNYLENGGTLEVAARLAGHASTKTTQLYDRTSNKVDLGEVEKIRI